MNITKAELEEMLSTLHKLRRKANQENDNEKSAACAGMIHETIKELDKLYKGAIEGAQSQGQSGEANQGDGQISSDESGVVGDVRSPEKNYCS